MDSVSVGGSGGGSVVGGGSSGSGGGSGSAPAPSPSLVRGVCFGRGAWTTRVDETYTGDQGYDVMDNA